MTIYFCNDGILRTSDINTKYHIALSFLQKDMPDLEFIASQWNQNVIVETDSTLASFLKCLEPWASFLSIYLQKDIKAFCQEVKKPCSLSEDNVDWITLGKHIEIFPDVSYQDSDIDKPSLGTKWKIKEDLELSAYKKINNQQYFIHHKALNKFANIPIYLNNTQEMIVDEYFTQKYGNKTNLLNSNAIGVQSLNSDMCPFKFVELDKDWTLKEIIEGFFSSFDKSPQDRDNINEDIKNSIEQTLENENFNNEQMEVIEEVFLEQRSLSKDLRQDYFDNTPFEKSLSDISSQLRIGKISKAKLPENRIMAWTKLNH